MPNLELECCTMTYREFRLRCPYGKWKCADGREVIFNRDYWPILERRPGEKAKPANPNEWIRGIRERDYFFDDANPPWDRRRRKAAADTLARCNRVLIAWGFPPLPKPTPPKAFGNLRDEPRVNPYGRAWSGSDSRPQAFRISQRQRLQPWRICK
jgi:hypothetical protein